MLALPAAALGWIAYSAYVVNHNVALPEALSGSRRAFSSRAGGLSYYVAGQGEPLLLIHSINASGSAYEVRPLFEHYRATRRVYALELPGFGFSERGDRAYTPRLYADAIFEMLDEIRRDSGADEIDALALSLSAEFLARTASEQPSRFRSLALVTPTGFGRDEQLYGPEGMRRGSRLSYATLSFPLWRQALYDLLTSKPSINYFLSKSFGSAERVDAGLAEYDYLTAHQPGAAFAPYHFVAGLLFSADIDRVYESLTLPVFLGYGTRGAFSNVEDTARVREKSNWTLQAFDTGGLPFWEDLAAFLASYEAFLVKMALR
jgi:pimeloyl-ACP methyl ester carboxylesterase